MKFLVLVVVVVLLTVVAYSGADETDVLRVFDPDLQLSEERITDILRQANLKEYGFKVTTETAIETDENGNESVKKTIHYLTTVDCSETVRVMANMKERLRDTFGSSELLGEFVREVNRRVRNRITKKCEIGLEIHPNSGCSGSPAKTGERKKRGEMGVEGKKDKKGSKSCTCLICWNGRIRYQ